MLAAQLMKPEKKEQLQRAIQRAEQILSENPVHNVDDARKVLQKMNIDGGIIQKVLGYADHPAVNAILGMSGINKDGLISDLQRLKGGNEAPAKQSAQNDDLGRFRAELERLGKK